MRERLVASFVGLTVLLLLVFGATRAYTVAGIVEQQEERKTSRSVELLATVLVSRTQEARPVSEEFLAGLLNPGEHLRYVAPDGSVVEAGARPDPSPGSGEALVETRRLGEAGSVTLTRSGEMLEARIADVLLPLVLLGLVLLVVAGLLGYVLARRLSRPFRELADVAGEIGRGRFDVQVPRYSVPEADAIGVALHDGATELGELVRREREFAANASHQLRTPITALRLELEDLTLWPETPPDVAEELTRGLRELDRLSGAVNDLLDLARGRRLEAAGDTDLGALVDESVERWTPTVRDAGRSISSRATGPILARLAPGPVAQILDVLVENALGHGEGAITVAAERLPTHLRVRVSDQGQAPSGTRIFARRVSRAGTGEGIGLAVATELADALGGHLALDPEGTTTTFSLMLPLPRGHG